MTKPLHRSRELNGRGRLLLPSLALSRFATRPPAILTGLLLIDIGLSFNLPVAVVGQIRTVASVVAAFSAIFTGALSVRVAHKRVLLLGLGILCVAAVGCALAVNFTMMTITYSMSELGWAIVSPMTLTLVATHFSIKKRVRAISIIMTVTALSHVIGAPIIGFIAEISGWRASFLGFVFPVALVSLLLAAKVLPSSSPQKSLEIKIKPWEGFNDVLKNRSAVACLFASAFDMAAWQAIVLYSSSLFRERFMVSIRFASTLVIGTALFFIIGSQICGRITNRLGKRPITGVTAVLMALFILSYTNIMHLWLALSCQFIASIFAGLVFTASRSLALEQVPRFRGPMMSLSSAAENLGMALGAGIGGLALLWLGYGGIGIVLGVVCIMAAIIYYFFVNDPTSTVIG